MDGNLLLHLHGTAHRPVNAIEYDQQRIASSLNNPAAMLIDRRVYQVPAECPQTIERSRIVQANQTAVANHVGIQYGDQLPPI